MHKNDLWYVCICNYGEKCWNRYVFYIHKFNLSPRLPHSVLRNILSVVCQGTTSLNDGEREGWLISMGVFLLQKHSKCHCLCTAILWNMSKCSKDFFLWFSLYKCLLYSFSESVQISKNYSVTRIFQFLTSLLF